MVFSLVRYLCIGEFLVNLKWFFNFLIIIKIFYIYFSKDFFFIFCVRGSVVLVLLNCIIEFEVLVLY